MHVTEPRRPFERRQESADRIVLIALRGIGRIVAGGGDGQHQVLALQRVAPGAVSEAVLEHEILPLLDQ